MVLFSGIIVPGTRIFFRAGNRDPVFLPPSEMYAISPFEWSWTSEVYTVTDGKHNTHDFVFNIEITAIKPQTSTFLLIIYLTLLKNITKLHFHNSKRVKMNLFTGEYERVSVTMGMSILRVSFQRWSAVNFWFPFATASTISTTLLSTEHGNHRADFSKHTRSRCKYLLVFVASMFCT